MRVELTVDGKAIPLSAFPQEIIGNASLAMAMSLRGVSPDWKKIEIALLQE